MRDLLDKLNQIMENRIVLGKSGTNAKKFMEKFLDISSPHPFEKNSRMLNNVVLNLEITGNKIRISDLYSLEKRTGNASKALKILTDLADDMSVNLEATVKPYTKNIQLEDLVELYTRHGFTVDDPEHFDYPDIGVDVTYYSR